MNGALNAILGKVKKFEERLNRVEATNRDDSLQGLTQDLERIEREVQEVRRQSTDTRPQPVEPLVTPRTEDELTQVAKLPDCVKELQVFDGSREHYGSWVHSVELVIKDYEIVRHKPIYTAILRHIRGKIRGAADSALLAHNIHDSDWAKIKETLSLHYADTRDIQTLEQQLTLMSQGRQRLSDFYSQIQKQLSLMINTIEPEKYAHKETIEALTEAHRRRALDVFIRGLNGDLPALLLVQNVKSLPEAYSACLKLRNADRRNAFHRPSLANRGDGNIIDTPSFSRNRRDYNGQGYSDQYHPRQPNNKRTWQDGNRKVPRPSYSGSGQTRPQNWRSTPSALVKSNYEPSSQSRNTRFTPYDGANRGAGSTGHMNQTASKQQKLFHLIPVDKEVIQDTASKEQLTEDQVNFTIGASCLAYHI